jgi:hypothetical protein
MSDQSKSKKVQLEQRRLIVSLALFWEPLVNQEGIQEETIEEILYGFIEATHQERRKIIDLMTQLSLTAYPVTSEDLARTAMNLLGQTLRLIDQKNDISN